MKENLRGSSCGRSIALDARDAEAARGTLDRLRVEVAELRVSRERLVRAADADRRWIERELHESVRQHLVALAVNLQRVGLWMDTDPAAAKELLVEIERDVQQALDETAELSERIYPAMIHAGGLAASLRAACDRAGIPASIDVRAGANRSAEVAATVYLCCVEALDRVGPRARATVTVREEEEALAFEVAGVVEDGEDDPRSEAVVGSEAGLDRLRDRVEALGGRLTILSERGRGIRILGSLPASR